MEGVRWNRRPLVGGRESLFSFFYLFSSFPVLKEGKEVPGTKRRKREIPGDFILL